MPLRDHVRPPLGRKRPWDELHGQWPAMLVLALNRRLPPRYVAAPHVRLGVDFEIATDLADQDEYEVRVYDVQHGRRLVAAIEIVSPANKDRPEHRRLFVAKCAALLRQHVSVALVDVVTTRQFNLYGDLLELIGQTDASLAPAPPVYAAACRWRRVGESPRLETWAYALAVGQPLPTLPLWLADDLVAPLDLEATYEETCRALRIARALWTRCRDFYKPGDIASARRPKAMVHKAAATRDMERPQASTL